ncbi:lipoprotein [Leptothrix discophora]|uniref:Lipoprotein n=2 Tax=Leptothrix discophora TaxID=89 RepID=A0ABT9G616_LEPDI|nr:lipoprotein [Leptothrix discophora]MDP4301928.1 lipoprotein [Leptothrix discophora]
MFSRRQTSLAPGFRGWTQPSRLTLAVVLSLPVTCLSLLAGCGQKGPLQRPADVTAASAASAAAASAPAAAPTRSSAPRSAP